MSDSIFTDPQVFTEVSEPTWELPDDVLGFIWAIDDVPNRAPETVSLGEARRLFSEFVATEQASEIPASIYTQLVALGIVPSGDGIATSETIVPVVGPLGEHGDYMADLSVLCQTCDHLRPALTCKAFPGGIPFLIRTGWYDHRKAYPGDQGIRYQSTPNRSE